MDVTLVLTHDCNLGCTYCYAGAKFRQRMSVETAYRGLDLAFDGDPPAVEVAFFGGEPLLCWDLLVDVAIEARRRAAALGCSLKLSVTTNGTLLTPERALRLDELGVYVALSIDGIRSAQDGGRPLMGGGSSFEAVCSGLMALLQRGTSFETISVVTPDNVAHLAESVRWLSELGVPRIGLNPAYELDFDDDALVAYGRGLTASAELMIEAFRGGRVISLPVFDNKILAALKGGLAAEDCCSLGARSVAVAPSGNVYPCERMVGEDDDVRMVMGQVGGELLVPRRECPPGPTNAECADCGERQRCSSSCACANMAETGRTDVAGGTQCWHEQTTGRLADRIAATLWQEQNAPFLAWFYGRMAAAGKQTGGHAPSATAIAARGRIVVAEGAEDRPDGAACVTLPRAHSVSNVPDPSRRDRRRHDDAGAPGRVRLKVIAR